MAAVITWPFDMLFSLSGIIVAWFIDRGSIGSINFVLVQMAVAIILVTISVALAVHGRGAVALFRHKG